MQMTDFVFSDNLGIQPIIIPTAIPIQHPNNKIPMIAIYFSPKSIPIHAK